MKFKKKERVRVSRQEKIEKGIEDEEGKRKEEAKWKR